ncbi:MAG: hypothetical protein U1F18_09730 [Steroidobacteraceae bacterium]
MAQVNFSTFGRIARRQTLLYHQSAMRTTLDIADDVLAAAQEIARRQKLTTGQVLSALARQALAGEATGSPTDTERQYQAFFGFESFAANGKIVTNAHIDELRVACQDDALTPSPAPAR